MACRKVAVDKDVVSKQVLVVDDAATLTNDVELSFKTSIGKNDLLRALRVIEDQLTSDSALVQ